MKNKIIIILLSIILITSGCAIRYDKCIAEAHETIYYVNLSNPCELNPNGGYFSITDLEKCCTINNDSGIGNCNFTSGKYEVTINQNKYLDCMRKQNQ